METIALTFMVISLLSVFTFDTLQKRQRFLNGDK